MSDWNEKIVAEFRANSGRVGGMFEGVPMILVHHVGARSGAERVTPLVHFPEDDQRTVIVASNGGAPKHPAWYFNLKANPKIEVEVGAERYTAVAEELPRAERDEFWKRVVAERPGFADYERTAGDRVIPLVRLTRVG
ncbi:MAG TPA: nitroreductase family deazaflavin-dependent oxidoreductase [Pseudonocardia sp.]|jgi:deazaflavin-dependent oxidoreductase (nitroreductase family)|uniref:nitroreductase family deazaflavin-dependent oxidoreductase n=1 Tax=Pseudonocardia sp. TaxID=60912 RepID=UPI002B4AD581|nr:nitroreductase family deazaflavin-dependent oxidoreductase [Pseudonocardia sp.]HLU58241.1 nitroreductase family deazaflavin-dependent oxidoreductase [Pseudonocardia sp.]